MMKRSLRKRIALEYVGVTGVVVAASFFLLYMVVREAVYNHLDDHLKAESIQVNHNLIVLSDSIVLTNPSDWEVKEHGRVEVNPLFLQMTDMVGSVVRKSINLMDNTLPLVPNLSGDEYFNSEISGSPIRQLQLLIKSPQGRVLGYLAIAMPREIADAVLNNLRTTLLVVYPLALILFYITSRLIAGRGIAPISTIIATAERITKENIDERIVSPPTKDELYRLTTTINHLLDRLQGALLREQQFTADAAHELLTPLASLRGTLEVLIRKPREPEHYVQKIAYCIQEVNRISNLVDQLLMIARADGGTLKPVIKSIDLSQSVHRVLERMEPLIMNKNVIVNLSAAENSLVKADVTMLDRILVNILSNAIKYSTEGDSIDIAVQNNGSTTSLSILDHGPGISEEEAKKIFDRFYRADKSRTSQVAGSGLGLAIVKRLADLQHISLSVQSTPSIGTTFIISFPR